MQQTSIIKSVGEWVSVLLCSVHVTALSRSYMELFELKWTCIWNDKRFQPYYLGRLTDSHNAKNESHFSTWLIENFEYVVTNNRFLLIASLIHAYLLACLQKFIVYLQASWILLTCPNFPGGSFSSEILVFGKVENVHLHDIFCLIPISVCSFLLKDQSTEIKIINRHIS